VFKDKEYGRIVYNTKKEKLVFIQSKCSTFEKNLASKKNKDFQVGQFGEGLEVGILSLLRAAKGKRRRDLVVRLSVGPALSRECPHHANIQKKTSSFEGKRRGRLRRDRPKNVYWRPECGGMGALLERLFIFK